MFRTSLASADEVRGALEIATAMGYLDDPATAPALELVDLICVMTYRLSQ